MRILQKSSFVLFWIALHWQAKDKANKILPLGPRFPFIDDKKIIAYIDLKTHKGLEENYCHDNCHGTREL